MLVGFEAVTHAVPDTVLAQSDLAYLDPVTPTHFVGPATLRRHEGFDAAEVLAEQAVAEVLADAGREPAAVDLILASRLGGQYVEPGIATYIHDRFGFPRSVATVNVNNECGSWLDSCHLAWGMIEAGRAQRALVVTSCAQTINGVDPTDHLARNFSHAAGAAIISADQPVCEFLAYRAETYGESYDLMNLALRDVANPAVLPAGAPGYGLNFGMNSEFFTWGADGKPADPQVEGRLTAANTPLQGEWLVGIVEKTLADIGMSLDDLGYVTLHQAVHPLFQGWIQAGLEAGLKREQFIETWDRYGNMGAADAVANLAELRRRGLSPGDLVALSCPGGSGQAQALLIRWLAAS